MRRPLRVLLVALALVVVLAVAGCRTRGLGDDGAVEKPSPSRAPASRTTGGAPVARPLIADAGGVSAHRFRPALGAAAAILVDRRSGQVLWALRQHASLPIASTTKIMTGLLAVQRLDPNRRLLITRAMTHVEPFREGLRPGERIAVRKLEYGLMLFSGNDDARALAVAVSGSRGGFVRLMNETAQDLGLRDTRFATPSGLVDRGNRASARDLAALARYALRDPRFAHLVSARVKRVAWPAPTFAKVYVNKNRLLTTYRGADGVKTGWTTKARHCLVASAHRSGRRLIAVVLGSPDAYADARRLLNFGFRLEGA